MKPSISIVICTYNRAESLKELLDCLLNQNIKDPYEVIVVDNNSKDSTKLMVESFDAKFQGKLRYVFEPNQGKPFALNHGIEKARGEILAFTDDDCLVGKDYLERILEAFQKYGDKIGIIGGKIDPHWVNGNKPEWIIDLKSGWWHKGFFTGPLGILNYGETARMLDVQDIKKEPLFYGANIAIPKTVLDLHGCFNTEKVLMQDTDICTRLFRAGVKGMYEPLVLVHHKINAPKITPHYYYRWYYLRGIFSEIQQKYQKKIYHPFGVQWEFIYWTAKFWVRSIFMNSLSNKIHYRSHAMFNLGQMVQLARKCHTRSKS